MLKPSDAEQGTRGGVWGGSKNTSYTFHNYVQRTAIKTGMDLQKMSSFQMISEYLENTARIEIHNISIYANLQQL